MPVACLSLSGPESACSLKHKILCPGFYPWLAATGPVIRVVMSVGGARGELPLQLLAATMLLAITADVPVITPFIGWLKVEPAGAVSLCLLLSPRFFVPACCAGPIGRVHPAL